MRFKKDNDGNGWAVPNNPGDGPMIQPVRPVLVIPQHLVDFIAGKPQTGYWRMDQPTKDPNVIDLYFDRFLVPREEDADGPEV